MTLEVSNEHRKAKASEKAVKQKGKLTKKSHRRDIAVANYRLSDRN
jgi:hypothetical protein